MQLFYAHLVQDKNAYLDSVETRHCTKTLRKKVGDTIHFIDGKGGLFEGQIQSFDKKSCEIHIQKKLPSPGQRNYNIHIAIAPTKQIKRLEWFLEKVTELGIDTITLLQTQHSERKKVRLDRLQKIVLAATKQSLKTILPCIHPLTKFNQFVSSYPQATKLIAHCHPSSDKKPLHALAAASNDLLILIGPEGDFSPQEVQTALQHNFTPITLSPSRLRTETAGIVACHTVHLLHAQKET